MSSTLSERALLVHLNISQWSARRIDKIVTKLTNSHLKAVETAGRYNKCLINPKALKPINRTVSAMRTTINDMTLPWFNDGTRLLPSDLYLEFERKMSAHSQEFTTAVADFIDAYPALVDAAKDDLGGMYNDNDYPAQFELDQKFSMAIHYMNVPDSADIRVDVSETQADLIKENVRKSIEKAQSHAMQDIWQRIQKVCGRMVERLNEYQPAHLDSKAQGIFRDSLVENIKELADVLPAMNIANDDHLNDISERMKNTLCKYSSDDLREDDSLRKDVAGKAQQILDEISAYM